MNARLLALAARSSPLALVLSGLYVLLRLGSFVNHPDRVTDTPTYERVAALPVWSIRFYDGVRPFVLPLYYKVVGDDHLRIWGQLAISTACWLLLAVVVARCFESRRVGRVAFVLVLGFSLTTPVILWDPLLLSESLSLSLTAVVLAAAFAVVRSPTRLRLGLLLASLLLWAFVRDSNAYEVLIVGLLLAVLLVWTRRRRLVLAFVAGALAIFVASTVSSDVGKRWFQPFKDIVNYRVLPRPDMNAYFERHGMSGNGDYAWMQRKGKQTYLAYLLSHPGYALLTPFSGTQAALYSTPDSARSLVSPSFRIYNDNAGDRFAPLPHQFRNLLYVQGMTSFLALTGAVLLLGVLVALRFGATSVWAVPVIVLLSTYPHLLAIWHLSGVEVDRHALEAALLWRFSILLLLVLSLDRVIASLDRGHGTVRLEAPAIEPARVAGPGGELGKSG